MFHRKQSILCIPGFIDFLRNLFVLYSLLYVFNEHWQSIDPLSFAIIIPLGFRMELQKRGSAMQFGATWKFFENPRQFQQYSFSYTLKYSLLFDCPCVLNLVKKYSIKSDTCEKQNKIIFVSICRGMQL